MPTKHCLYVGATPTEYGLDYSHRLAPANDGDSLAAVLHRIEEVRELACCIRCTEFGHHIRVSDYQINMHAFRSGIRQPGHRGRRDDSLHRARRVCYGAPTATGVVRVERRSRAVLLFVTGRAVVVLTTPSVNDWQRYPFRLGRQLVAEGLAQQMMNDRMESFLCETVPIVFRFPHVDVAQPPLGALDGDVDDQPPRRCVSETMGDPLVEGGVNRDILREGIGHRETPHLLRIEFGLIMIGVVKEVKKGRAYDATKRRRATRPRHGNGSLMRHVC